MSESIMKVDKAEYVLKITYKSGRLLYWATPYKFDNDLSKMDLTDHTKLITLSGWEFVPYVDPVEEMPRERVNCLSYNGNNVEDVQILTLPLANTYKKIR